MAQMMETVEPSAADDQWPEEAAQPSEPPRRQDDFEEFNYRPMPILAPVAGVLGLCSLASYLGLFGIGLAVMGVFVSLLAVIVVKRGQGALSGMWLAMSGLLLCTANATAGIGLQVYHYNHEVPDGYDRISFSQQISKPGFNVENGQQTIPAPVEALVDREIFLKGFMYPTGQTEGLPSFLLLKDSGQCCFGGKPKLQDMIGVRMTPGKEVDYRSGRVAVAGTFKLNSNYQGGSLDPIYILEAEHFSKAMTSF